MDMKNQSKSLICRNGYTVYIINVFFFLTLTVGAGDFQKRKNLYSNHYKINFMASELFSSDFI